VSGAALAVGVVADSHGFLCDATRRALAGSDLILHAGDIGGREVLAELGAIAPVLAVAGNGDPELAHELPLEQRVEVAGCRILLCHWYDNFGRIHPAIARELEAYRPHALVYGHTHAAVNARRGGCLHFNPGYAGPPGPGRRRSLGRLRLAAGAVEGEIVELA
jgi:putative phosphoesterase